MVEVLVLVEAGEDERLLLRLGVDVALEALRADLLHHALHRGVDRADADVLLREVRREHAVAGILHRAHHPVGADSDDAADVAQVEHRPVRRRVPEHRLDDVADEGEILLAARHDRLARVDRPDHLIVAGLDFVALEDVVRFLVAGEVNHLVAIFLERLGDREQHRVAEAAAEQEHRLVLRNLRRRAGRAHHHDLLARLQICALPR